MSKIRLEILALPFNLVCHKVDLGEGGPRILSEDVVLATLDAFCLK